MQEIEISEELKELADEEWSSMLDSMQTNEKYMALSDEDRQVVDKYIFNVLAPSQD